MTELNEHYDVVIVGGAMMGSSTAWWLSRESGFDGSVLVVERDPSYEHSSTSATNSCVRQQLRAAPADSASKKLGRADWCSGAKRAIQAPSRPNALLIQQRHTPGPSHGSV